MALNVLICAEVPLRNYSLTHPSNAGIVSKRLHTIFRFRILHTYTKFWREGLWIKCTWKNFAWKRLTVVLER